MRTREQVPKDVRAFLRQRAKQMRRAMTPAERLLWSHLRNDQLDGLRFRRQQPVGPYVADFMCPKIKLIVEVDGDVHATAEQLEKDRVRTEYLVGHGLYVMRFNNREVLSDVEECVEEVRRWVSERASGGPKDRGPCASPSPRPSPRSTGKRES